MTDRIRYLISPPRGFCAAFVLWAESKELALAYAREWLGRELPPNTVVLRYLTHDKLSCMYVGHDGHPQTQTNTQQEQAA